MRTLARACTLGSQAVRPARRLLPLVPARTRRERLAPTRPGSISATPLGRLVESRVFTAAVVAVILLNALTIAAETFGGFSQAHRGLLDQVGSGCLAFFVIELLLRLAAHGRRPDRFLARGWNAFDTLVIALAFVPGVRENATLLRLARLGRVTRLVRLLPDFALLIAAVRKSLPPLASVGALTLLILFIYGEIGWLLFADARPEQWGDIGRAMLTLFVMLTAENLATEVEAGTQIVSWSWVYFGSFILIVAFVVLNVLIGVVLNSMDEARKSERQRKAEEAHTSPEAPPRDGEAVTERIALMRRALDELEHEVATAGATASPDGRGPLVGSSDPHGRPS